MTDMSISPVVHDNVDPCAGGGEAVRGVTRCLALAATPTFALMAVWTGFFGGQPDMFCAAMRGSSPLNGMELMYLLMGTFHVSPWLKLICRNGALP